MLQGVGPFTTRKHSTEMCIFLTQGAAEQIPADPPPPLVQCARPPSTPLCPAFVAGGEGFFLGATLFSLGNKPSDLGHWQVSVLPVTAEGWKALPSHPSPAGPTPTQRPGQSPPLEGGWGYICQNSILRMPRETNVSILLHNESPQRNQVLG